MLLPPRQSEVERWILDFSVSCLILSSLSSRCILFLWWTILTKSELIRGDYGEALWTNLCWFWTIAIGKIALSTLIHPRWARGDERSVTAFAPNLRTLLAPGLWWRWMAKKCLSRQRKLKFCCYKKWCVGKLGVWPLSLDNRKAINHWDGVSQGAIRLIWSNTVIG